MLGSWKIDVNTSGMPQKVATAFAELNEMVGAEYEMIAYVGSQVVNGTNHAVLAQQTIIAGKDVKNIVLIIFHETKEGTTVSAIERVVESGGELGGIQIDPKTDIPAEAKEAFDAAFEGFVGSDINPFVLLGTQVTKGVDYIFAATVAPVVPDPEVQLNLVIVNGMTKSVAFVDLLTAKNDSLTLGYAFTWLKRENTSVGKPLGEWP